MYKSNKATKKENGLRFGTFIWKRFNQDEQGIIQRTRNESGEAGVGGVLIIAILLLAVMLICGFYNPLAQFPFFTVFKTWFVSLNAMYCSIIGVLITLSNILVFTPKYDPYLYSLDRFLFPAYTIILNFFTLVIFFILQNTKLITETNSFIIVLIFIFGILSALLLILILIANKRLQSTSTKMDWFEKIILGL